MQQLHGEDSRHVPRLLVSTNGIAPSDRVDFWRERTAQIAFPLTLREWRDDQRFIIRPLGGIAMIDMTCQLTERSHSDIVKKSGDCVVLARQQSGKTLLESRGGRESIQLKPGDVAVVDPDQPFVHTSNGGILRVWAFPRAMLSYVPTVVDESGGVMRLSDDGPAKLVRIFIDELGSQIERLRPLAAEAFAAQAAQILSIALSSRLQRGQGEATRKNAAASVRLLHLHNVIERRLGDPLLSVARIAADCGISPRTVHYVFDSSGTTFANHVLARRLETVSAALSNPRNSFTSIAELAFACGFNSLSNFYLRYRERFGEAPGETRGRDLQ
ncbi:MAG TPA: AraC family transcriptional regulator [Sphingomicrobium sp.]|nr:AraC family transcriptional regulator [Sphingomicrobium sp.]